jgi:hypothetical protein
MKIKRAAVPVQEEVRVAVPAQEVRFSPAASVSVPAASVSVPASQLESGLLQELDVLFENEEYRKVFVEFKNTTMFGVNRKFYEPTTTLYKLRYFHKKPENVAIQDWRIGDTIKKIKKEPQWKSLQKFHTKKFNPEILKVWYSRLLERHNSINSL